MKKFMLRGEEKDTNTKCMPKSLEYGVWYNLVTPFDWKYFKLKRGSRYVHVYDFMGDKKPLKVQKGRFLEMLAWAKSPISLVDFDDL